MGSDLWMKFGLCVEWDFEVSMGPPEELEQALWALGPLDLRGSTGGYARTPDLVPSLHLEPFPLQ